ncbi:MAG: hypothetical protein JWN11_1253, partial [Hyphomicrobiales bacterium]|nr:hypothetical protein [Hyphomicrobiales bacterium]
MGQATQRLRSNSLFLAVVAVLLTAIIFSVDAFTNLGMAIAALYSVVILLSSRFLDRRGVWLVSLGCAGLTIAGYLLSHGLSVTGMPILRFLVSLAAIGTTAFLALEDKAASAKLRERAGLLDLTRDGIFVRDMNEVITYWNRGAEEAYGWTAAQVVGKATIHDLLHTVFPQPLERIKTELLNAGRWEGELVHTKADGGQMVVSSRWALQRDKQQRPRAILETNNDITAQRRATEALRESEEQWREVFEHNPVMYFMVDAAGLVLSVNSFGAGQLGYTVDELLGRSVLEVFREEDREFIRQNLASCVAASGQSRNWEVRTIRKDGSVLWVRENAKAVRRPGGGLIVLVACEDITERKQNEDLLRRSQAHLAEAQRLSQVGSFGWQIATSKLTWSEETFRIFGYDMSVSPTLDLVLERTHPEDRDIVRQTIEKVKGEALDYEHEYRLLMPDETVKHVHIVARTSKDSSGSVEMVGAVMDVTSAKEAESRIQQIIDAVPATIWRTRSDGSMDFLNARALQYVGMSMQEVLNSGWGGQVHPDDFPQAYGNWLVGFAERKPIESVLRVKRFDGEYRWFLSRAMPLLDKAGNILAWYGSDADIHDRKLAEEALLKVRADLAHVTRVTTLGELSASIAHEVNQPLAAIVTNGEIGIRL